MAVDAETKLFDRTPGQGDKPPLAYGGHVSGLLRHNNSASSTGDVYLSGQDYPVGKDVEIAFDIRVTMTGVHPANVWHNCTGGNHNLLRCSGVGTQTLDGSWGTGPFPSLIAPPARTFGTQAQSCWPGIQKEVIRDDAKRESTVSYSAHITCRSGFAPNIQMVMDLYDRTPSTDGQPLTLRKSGSGNGTVVLNDNPPLFDRNYPRGIQAEIVIEATLRTTDGSRWTRCLPVPIGLREARPCEGLGTDTLKVYVGTGNFPTGVKQPPQECRQDHEPIFGLPTASSNPVIKVTPHIQYCGYLDWGTNSHITEVKKLAPTEIEILSSVPAHQVCDVNFVPQGADGTTSIVGPDGQLKVQVLFTTSALVTCSVTLSKTITIDRLYQRNGTVINRTPLTQ